MRLSLPRRASMAPPPRPHRLPVISLLLLALVARALVPTGFMPSGDGSAQLLLCPDGMLMPADPASNAAGAPGPAHLHANHCPFGSAPFAAPIAHIPVIPVLAGAIIKPALDPALRIPAVRSAATHQPRAPPHLIVA